MFYVAVDQTTNQPVYFTTKGQAGVLPAGCVIKEFDDDTKARSGAASYETEQRAVALAKLIFAISGREIPEGPKADTETATALRSIQTALTHNDNAQAVEMFTLLKASGLLDGKMRKTS